MKFWVCLLLSSALGSAFVYTLISLFLTETVSKGITPTGPTEFNPITKGSVTYIVAGVIVNEHKEVLMMQEAKRACSGQ